jgi:hypothetical protein
LTISSESETTSRSSIPSSAAFSRPATSALYSATLFVATPIVWPSDAIEGRFLVRVGAPQRRDDLIVALVGKDRLQPQLGHALLAAG